MKQILIDGVDKTEEVLDLLTRMNSLFEDYYSESTIELDWFLSDLCADVHILKYEVEH